MTATAPSPAPPEPPRAVNPSDCRDRRVYVWWAATLGLLALLGLFCWAVVMPLLETRSLVADDFTSEQAADRIRQLGGPDKAAQRLDGFLRLPTWLIRESPESPYRLRSHAVDLLGACGKPAVDILIRKLSDPDEVIRGEAARMFQIHSDDLGPDARRSVPGLLRMFASPGPETTLNERITAAGALGALRSDTATVVPQVARVLRNEKGQIRRHAAGTLCSYGSAAAPAVPELTLALEDEDEATRDAAVQALGLIGPPSREATPRLAALLLREAEPRYRERVADTLGSIGPDARAAVPALARALAGDQDRSVRWSVAKALCSIGPDAKAAVPALVKALEDDFYEARRTAAKALGQIGPAAEAAIPALEKASLSSGIMDEAKAALKKIRGDEKEPRQ